MFGKNISCNVWVDVKEWDSGIENNEGGKKRKVLNFTHRRQR